VETAKLILTTSNVTVRTLEQQPAVAQGEERLNQVDVVHVEGWKTHEEDDDESDEKVCRDALRSTVLLRTERPP